MDLSLFSKGKKYPKMAKHHKGSIRQSTRQYSDNHSAFAYLKDDFQPQKVSQKTSGKQSIDHPRKLGQHRPSNQSQVKILTISESSDALH